MLFSPVGTPFELLDQELDLPLVLPNSVRLSTTLSKHAVSWLGDRAFFNLESLYLVRLRSPRLLLLNVLDLIRGLVNPHRVTILNLTWPVHVNGLLPRYSTGIAALAMLTYC